MKFQAGQPISSPPPNLGQRKRAERFPFLWPAPQIHLIRKVVKQNFYEFNIEQ
jgi:hypothetical protein